jgi:Zn-finger nucleic acid-binding protein
VKKQHDFKHKEKVMNYSDKLYCVNCPKSELKKVQCENDLTIDQCTVCGGLWLDSGELITLLKIGDFYIKNLDTLKGNPVTISQEQRYCPLCRSPLKMMTNNKAPDVKIDRCAKCKGVWLDRGELYKLADIYKKNT